MQPRYIGQEINRIREFEKKEIIFEIIQRSLFYLVKMFTSYFKDLEKMNDSSKFVIGKIRLELNLDENYDL